MQQRSTLSWPSQRECTTKEYAESQHPGCLEDIATVVSQSSEVSEVQLVGMQNGTSIVPKYMTGPNFWI